MNSPLKTRGRPPQQNSHRESWAQGRRGGPSRSCGASPNTLTFGTWEVLVLILAQEGRPGTRKHCSRQGDLAYQGSLDFPTAPWLLSLFPAVSSCSEDPNFKGNLKAQETVVYVCVCVPPMLEWVPPILRNWFSL